MLAGKTTGKSAPIEEDSSEEEPEDSEDAKLASKYLKTHDAAEADDDDEIERSEHGKFLLLLCSVLKH